MELIMIIIEFAVIVALQVIGIGLHVMQKILALDKQYPELSRREIVNTFFENDMFTLWVSALVLSLNVIVHLVIHLFAPEIMLSIPYFLLWAFGAAFVLGYAGQRLIYKALGSTETFLNSKIENKLK